MASDEGEEELLRAVALQNANAILIERRRAEEKLARSLAMMRATLESTTDGILATDGDGRVTGSNQNYRELWQIPSDVMDSLDHHKLVDFCARQFDDPNPFRSRIEEIYATSPPESLDVLELTDGRVFERHSRIQYVGGQNVGRVWSFRDITERRRAADALRKQSEWLRVTLSSIGDAVITTGPDGKVLFLNRVAEALTRWRQDQAQGRPLHEVFRIINEHSRQVTANPADRALQEGRIVGLANHTLLIAKDGTETPIDDSAAPIRDDQGRHYGAVLVFRDIGERRKAELALRQSERELSDFFENASVGLHWVGPDGTILRVNRAELDLLGYDREEYIGRNIAEFHADQDVIADILRRLTAGEVLRDYESRLRCKDGSIKYVLIDSSVLWRDGRFAHTRCFTRDITDRKRADETQARLAAIVESSQDAIISKGIDQRIVSWNTGAERLFGHSAQDAIGQSITLIIPPDRHNEEAAIIERLRRGERIEHYETVRISKAGRLIDVSLTISPVRDGNGRIIGASKIVRDITDRKQIELAISRSEAQFRQLADALPQLIWTARPDGFVDYYNERWYEFTGFPRDEFGDQSWKPILHPDDLQRCVDTYYGCIRSGKLYQIECRFKDRRSDGYRWFLSRAHPVRDEQGQIVRWIGTYTDIDDNKRTEETTRFLADASAALAELSDYKRTLQKVAGLAVPHFADWCAIDMQEADGTIQRLAVSHSNPAQIEVVQDLFRRYPPQSTDPHGVMNVLRTGKSEWMAKIQDSLLAGLARDREHFEMMRRIGLKSYICTPLRSRDLILGVITFAMAESGRIYDVKDLAAAEDLAQRAAIAIENANLLAALKNSDRRKDEFLAMLAHELRNPLAPIRNAVQIFRSERLAVPELLWATDVIDRQVHQMTRLVDDLLDVSRITRGKIELRKEPVELAVVLNNAVEASRPLIEKWGHELTVSIPTEPIVLQADPTRLAQVFLNLLNNAAKYMDSGGHIWVSAERQDEQALIRVLDTGIGIPAEMLSHIFDIFTQVEHSLERSEGGLGLGLTLVQQLVEMHGGSVEACSDGVGKGSEFLVRLPIPVNTHDGEAGRVPDGCKSTVALTSRRILIVDDNRDSADTMGMLLRDMGNEVRTAYDGLEAVAAATAYQPEVVLLDIGLPKLNGYEAARRIRNQPGGDEMLLIALTGWGQEEDRRRSRHAGFDHHLTKPVEFGILEKLLAEFNPHRPRND
jgi:PAS domain S-box-containing protein